MITFESSKFVRTGHNTYEVDGDFNIRGVSNPEKLTLVVSGKGTGTGELKGKMVFNRKDCGMNKGIPFIKIADHVEVNFHLKGRRAGGPPLLDDSFPAIAKLRIAVSSMQLTQQRFIRTN